MRISDWSSDVCSSDLTDLSNLEVDVDGVAGDDVIWVRNSDAEIVGKIGGIDAIRLTLIAPLSIAAGAADTVTVEVELLEAFPHPDANDRSEEHTSELQSLMRISYAVLCLKKTIYHAN